MSTFATVEPLHMWLHDSGRTASFYGAKPAGDGWRVVQEGYTIRWPDGTVGIPTGASQRLGTEGRNDKVKVEAAMRNLVAMGFRGFSEYSNW